MPLENKRAYFRDRGTSILIEEASVRQFPNVV